MNDPFFIGYLPHKPSGHRKSTRAFVGVAVGVFLVLAVVFVSAQHYSESNFSFGQFEIFEGTARVDPVPHLVLDDGSRLALVAPGKRGADALMESHEGNRVRLSGQRIERGRLTMLEVDANSVRTLRAEGAAGAWAAQRTTRLQVTGEIVGAKCYLGVMNPGSGPTHVACARHCILGGVPAMLHVPFADGEERAFYISGLERSRLVEFAGRTVQVSGVLGVDGGLPVLDVTLMEQASSARDTDLTRGGSPANWPSASSTLGSEPITDLR